MFSYCLHHYLSPSSHSCHVYAGLISRLMKPGFGNQTTRFGPAIYHRCVNCRPAMLRYSEQKMLQCCIWLRRLECCRFIKLLPFGASPIPVLTAKHNLTAKTGCLFYQPGLLHKLHVVPNRSFLGPQKTYAKFRVSST